MDARTQGVGDALVAAQRAARAAYSRWQAAGVKDYLTALEGYVAACKAEKAAEAEWNLAKNAPENRVGSFF